MAFVFFLIGGMAGMIAMLTSIFIFDASIFTALAVWFGTGMAISLAGVALAMAPQAGQHTGQLVEA
jgi:hypothetical protein